MLEIILTINELDHSLPACLPAGINQPQIHDYHYCGAGKKIGVGYLDRCHFPCPLIPTYLQSNTIGPFEFEGNAGEPGYVAICALQLL